MVAGRTNTVQQKELCTLNRRHLSFIYGGLLWSLLSLSSSGQDALAPTPADTNKTPDLVTPVEVTPVITNQPPVIKPKPVIKTSGPNVLSSFGGPMGGACSLAGRSLKLPAPEATARSATDWRRNLDFGMTRASGNSDTLRYSLGIDAVKEKEANLIRFRARGAYGESEGVKDTQNAETTLRYERLLTKQVYALGNLDWLTDPIAELDYRITGILSPGFRVIHSDTAILNLELGAGYIEEKKDNAEDGYAAGRAAATVEKRFNAHVLSWATVEYLPKIADTSVFFVNTEIGLAAYITRDLNLNVCYQERYDSTPVEGKKNSDTLLSTSLSLNF